MKLDQLVRKFTMECPVCDMTHEVEERCRTTAMLVKGTWVEFEEHYFYCANADEDENEFAPAKVNSENLMNARNAYRQKMGLLTSGEIVALRQQYGLSQVDMARLLGWGEATISRYESKAIQDDAYDNVMRIIRDNPLMAYDFLKKNKDKFDSQKYNEIHQCILENLDTHGREFLKKQILESKYVDYSEPSDFNGFKTLDVPKLECVISYLAQHLGNLYKVKLMKMLWYADALFFKENGTAMTGLVYCHEAMGALPLGHYEILDLENVNVCIEEDFEFTKYHIMKNESLDLTMLSPEELGVLNRVIDKFRGFTSKQIVNYMHEERAYLDTESGEVIPFSLAKEIREF